MLISGIVCRENSELTALINSDKGAKDVKLICQKTSISIYVIITPFQYIHI